jgi:anti-sigma regulatory factor (Ser/Thr protein kinase)
MPSSGDTKPHPAPGPASRCGLLTLPSERRQVRTARRFTDALLRSWEVPAGDRDSAVLIVDELASNAAEHGHADTTLAVVLEDDMVLISVTDSGAPRGHRLLADGDPDEHGRGTHIVEFLAHRMHVRLDAEGCQVDVALRLSAGVSDPRG